MDLPLGSSAADRDRTRTVPLQGDIGLYSVRGSSFLRGSWTCLWEAQQQIAIERVLFLCREISEDPTSSHGSRAGYFVRAVAMSHLLALVSLQCLAIANPRRLQFNRLLLPCDRLGTIPLRPVDGRKRIGEGSYLRTIDSRLFG